MMNEHGKSDRPVVPEKSPNKAGQPAAEGMEGRGLTKGNPHQQNASRTQSRNDAHSALERVRQAARKDKKLRFTALMHHVWNLDRFGRLTSVEEGGRGRNRRGDLATSYGENLEENLQDLSERLHGADIERSRSEACT